MRILMIASAVAALVSALACEGAGRSGNSTGSEVRDSAGVRIVVGHAPSWSETTAWTIEPEPILQIGEREGEDAYLFQTIAPVVRLSDGSIAVVERVAREIRIFDASGAHVRTFGGEGGGPGEFTGTPDLVVTPGDTLLVFDRRANRYSWFLRDGTLVREAPFNAAPINELIPGSGYNDVLLPDGAQLYAAEVRPPMVRAGPGRMTTPPGEILDRKTSIALVLDRGNRVVHLGSDFPRTQTLSNENAMAVNEFAPFVIWAAQASPLRVHLSSPGAWEIRTFDGEGNLTRIARPAIPKQVLSDSIIEASIERMRAGVGEPSAELLRELYERVGLPDTVPPNMRIEVDREGNLWLATSAFLPESSGTYHVLDTEGRWLGSIDVPFSVSSVEDIGSDYILVRWFDDVNVPYVRLYRLVKP